MTQPVDRLTTTLIAKLLTNPARTIAVNGGRG
jgi:hypothetical protein